MQKKVILLVLALLSAPSFAENEARVPEASSVAPRFLARESLIELGNLSSPADQRKAFQISVHMGELGRALHLREDQQDAWAAFLKETLSAFLASSVPIAIQGGVAETPEIRFALREAIVKEHLARLQQYRTAIQVFHGILDKDQQVVFDEAFQVDKKIGLEGNPFAMVR